MTSTSVVYFSFTGDLIVFWYLEYWRKELLNTLVRVWQKVQQNLECTHRHFYEWNGLEILLAPSIRQPEICQKRPGLDVKENPYPLSYVSICWSLFLENAHIVWKMPRMSHLNIQILAFSILPVNTDLSGNTVWHNSPKWIIMNETFSVIFKHSGLLRIYYSMK